MLLHEATHNVFLNLVLIAVGGFAALFLMPRRTEHLTFERATSRRCRHIGRVIEERVQ